MLKSYASGGVGSAKTPKSSLQSRGRVASNKQVNRTWNTRFAFNGSQISNDGKYQINPVRTPYGTTYELIAFNGKGGSRIGVFNSLDAAKSNAK